MLLRTHSNRISRRAGFTLMEILVVVAIIVILASLGGFMLINQFEGSKEGAAQAKMSTVDQAITKFYIDNGDYPGSLQDLVAAGILKQKAILDPWNNPIRYEVNQGTYQLSVQTPKGKVIPFQ